MPLDVRTAGAAIHVAGRQRRDRRHARGDRRRGRGGRVLVDLGDGPLPADPPGRARVGGDARGLHDARLPRRAHHARRASARCARASRTATSPPSARSSPPSTCCPAGGRWPGSGSAGSSASTELYGWEFPPRARRYELLEDALQLLPLLWGKGSPRFEGRTVTVPEAICYPRPLQEHIPILVGGSGERRTLRLVARYADACNLFGDAATVRHKVDVLHRHCADVDRDPGRGDGDEPDVGPGDRRRRRTTRRRTPARWTSRSVATARTPKPACRRPSCRSPTSPRAASSASPPCSPRSADLTLHGRWLDASAGGEVGGGLGGGGGESSRAISIARSSCGSRPAAMSAGERTTSMSGSTPWFSTPHS